MKVLVGAAVVAGIAWIAAPWVAMARRGTLDQQALADMRASVIPRQRRPLGTATDAERTETTMTGVSSAPESHGNRRPPAPARRRDPH